MRRERIRTTRLLDSSSPRLMTPLLLGIDVGTTNVKAGLYEPDGRAVAGASVPTSTHYPRPHWAYYRPDELWSQTVKAISEAVSHVEDAKRITGIAVASMGEAAVPLDAHGEPTYDAIAWFDTRTQPQVEWLDRVVGKDSLFRASGLSLQPIFGLCKMLWLKENEPGAFRLTSHWLNVADYIAFRLCGVPATDSSLASRTLALDLQRLRWNDGLLKDVGVPESLFAPLVPSGSAIGHVTAEASTQTGLPTGATVAAGGHDHVVGAFATGVTDPGTMLNSLGTAEAVFLPLKQPVANPRMGRQGYTQGAHVVPGHYYLFAGQYTSGASIEWVRELIGEAEDYDVLLAEAATTPPGSLGACFLPHLRLANPPYDDPKSRGAFIGLTTDTKRGALARAVLEGLAFETRHSMDPAFAYPGVDKPREIVAIGGGTRNGLLMRIKATVMNQPITIAGVGEATTLGAAMLGGIGAGVYANTRDALNAVQVTRTRVPPIADEVVLHESIYREVYQQLYLTLRPLHHAIHGLQHSIG